MWRVGAGQTSVLRSDTDFNRALPRLNAAHFCLLRRVSRQVLSELRRPINGHERSSDLEFAWMLSDDDVQDCLGADCHSRANRGKGGVWVRSFFDGVKANDRNSAPVTLVVTLWTWFYRVVGQLISA